MKTGGSLSRLCYSLSKIQPGIFNSKQTCQFLFSSRLPRSYSFQKHKFHRKEVAQILRGWVGVRDIVGKMSFFLKHPQFPSFLWVVVHFIAVIYCILDLTNSFREDW